MWLLPAGSARIKLRPSQTKKLNSKSGKLVESPICQEIYSFIKGCSNTRNLIQKLFRRGFFTSFRELEWTKQLSTWPLCLGRCESSSELWCELKWALVLLNTWLQIKCGSWFTCKSSLVKITPSMRKTANQRDEEYYNNTVFFSPNCFIILIIVPLS